MVKFSAVAVAVSLALAACSTEAEQPAAATSPVVTSAVTTSPVVTSPIRDVPVVLADFPIGRITLAGTELVVAIADDERLRPRGLMGVTDLGSLDGMIFLWPADTEASFWMKDTLIPLEIAWFDASGSVVSRTVMVPCDPSETCTTYEAAGPYRYALEMPQGTMPSPGPGATLVLVEGF